MSDTVTVLIPDTTIVAECESSSTPCQHEQPETSGVGADEGVNSNTESVFDELTKDLVRKILSHIPAKRRFLMQRVCKRWQTELKCPDLWTDYRHLVIGSDYFGRAVTLRLRFMLPRIGRNVRRLSLRGPVHTEHIMLLHKFCKSVTHIDFEIGLLNEQLHLIGLRFGPSVRVLNFMKLFADQEAVVEKFFTRSPGLQDVSFSRFCEITGSCLRGLGNVPLKSLVVNRNELFRTEWLYLCLPEYQFLRSLSLVNCQVRAWDAMDDLCELRSLNLACASTCAQLLCFTEKMQHLVDLDVSFCREVDDVILESISECKNLRILNLAGCREITDEGIKHLASCPMLEYLNLSDFQRNFSMVPLIQATLVLPHIKLLGLDSVTSPVQTATFIATNMPWVQTLATSIIDEKNLEQLLQDVQKGIAAEKLIKAEKAIHNNGCAKADDVDMPDHADRADEQAVIPTDSSGDEGDDEGDESHSDDGQGGPRRLRVKSMPCKLRVLYVDSTKEDLSEELEDIIRKDPDFQLRFDFEWSKAKPNWKRLKNLPQDTPNPPARIRAANIAMRRRTSNMQAAVPVANFHHPGNVVNPHARGLPAPPSSPQNLPFATSQVIRQCMCNLDQAGDKDHIHGEECCEIGEDGQMHWLTVETISECSTVDSRESGEDSP